MSRHDTRVYFRQMLEHAREASDLIRGKTRLDLEQSRLLQLGLTRLVEIVGEAAARVPKNECARWPQLPWEDIIGMRNRLIHGYDRVDLQILWDTVEGDLPGLIAELEKIVLE